MIKYLIFIIIGYLIGSLNFSIIIGKLFYKTDVRNHGSKNAGATNTLRTLGKTPAICVLFLDTLKGVLAFFVAYLFTKDYTLSYIAATAGSLGHNFPVYFGFRGGKGVTVSLGTIFCFNPLLATITLVVGVSLIAITKYVSLGAILSSIFAVILFSIFDPTPVKLILLAFLALQIIFQHRQNIKRLFLGTESKITFKKK